ncbi:MAG: hypothetical protein GY854_18710, partial [Deltaproteobacteria bacterium]|nr:hypothetical protein [Deltaproteobacteria bacterium]
FMAVCGESRADIEPYTIIQIPFAEGAIGEVSKDDFEAAQSEVQSLLAERDRLTTARDSLESALKEERIRGEELKERGEQVETLKEQFEQLKLELGNRGVRIGSLEKELEEELMQSEAARARAVQLAKDFDNERKAAQKKQLENEFSRRSSQMELQAKVQELSAELRQAGERSNSAETARDELVDRMRADVADLDALREKYDETKAEKQRLIEQEASFRNEIADLQKKNTEIDKRAAEAESKLVGLNELKESVEHEREVQSEENTVLETRLKEKAGGLGRAEVELGRREAIIRDLIVELERREEAASEHNEQIGRLELEIEGFKGAKAGHHRARVEAELSLATAEIEIERLKG